MGAANVIPGVSGGTIAFITGIYQRLIDAIKSFDLQALKQLVSFQFKAFSEKTDLIFLISIFSGIGISILSLARLLELAFEYYETFTLSFFFGLIIASIFGVGRQISQVSVPVVIAFIIGTAIAGTIAFLPPAEPNAGILYVMICGVVAVCSMILPGLSGSYVLLLMGNYVLVLQAISNFNFGILIPLLIGCIVGLVAFSWLLSYLFENFKDQTISLLTGFVFGSLLIIWPWKETVYMILDSGKEKATGYIWQLPAWDLNFVFSLLLGLVGFFIVWLIDKKGEQSGDSSES